MSVSLDHFICLNRVFKQLQTFNYTSKNKYICFYITPSQNPAKDYVTYYMQFVPTYVQVHWEMNHEGETKWLTHTHSPIRIKQ